MKQKNQNKAPNYFNRKITGIIKRHPDGYGFFIADETSIPDLYVAKHSMAGVMTNDRVKVQPKRDGARTRADIIEIIERKTKQVSGPIKRINSSQGLMVDSSFAWGEDLKVSWSPQLQLKDKDWVVVKITSYPDSLRGFQGTVEAVVGDISDPLNDNIRVLAAHSIPQAFSKNSIAEANSLPNEVVESDFRGRKDLRKLNFITIDGKTAKDFDDAIYVEKSKGGFHLWVAIADVSHYVKPGSAIDKDAVVRGTSTYFPNFVAPMLPEALSNELCSLKPKVPRLALVAEMKFDFQGKKTYSNFYEAVIESKARVTYGEAQEIIDKNRIEKLDHVSTDIKLAAQLSQILMEKRFREGSLNLELPESTIEVDSAGIPVDIIRADRLFAHRLIEELMLAANVAVAEFLTHKNFGALFRVHAPPKLDALQTLETFLSATGYGKKLGTTHLQKRITQVLAQFEDPNQQAIVHMLTLRSMNQAKYSPENIGHFGLGFSKYAHFTSPIRRYPDLIIHRLVKAALGIKNYHRLPQAELEDMGSMLSACEQRSVKAERQVQAIKKARFLEKHLGEEFDGTIMSVAKFGVFVTLRAFDVDGLVKVEELGSDHFEFDDERLRLVGRKTGKVYGLGDSLKVQVAACDHQLGRVDFVRVKSEKSKNAVEKTLQSNKERGPTSNDSQRFREIRVSGHHRKDKPKTSHRTRKAHSRKHK